MRICIPIVASALRPSAFLKLANEARWLCIENFTVPWMEDEVQLYKKFIDRKILIKYAGDGYFTGVCRSIDGYLNTVLEGGLFFEGDDAEPISVSTGFVKGGALRHIELLE